MTVLPATAATTASGTLAFGLGVILLFTLLFAWAGMFAALRWQVRRGRRRTRTAAWLGAVTAASLGFAAFYLYGVSRLPAGSLRKIPEQVKTVRDTMDVKLPPVLERMAGGKERIKAQQEMTKGMLDSPAFIWWSLAAGMTVMCVVFGSLVGSMAFGVALIGGRVVKGAWPLRVTEGDGVGERHY